MSVSFDCSLFAFNIQVNDAINRPKSVDTFISHIIFVPFIEPSLCRPPTVCLARPMPRLSNEFIYFSPQVCGFVSFVSCFFSCFFFVLGIWLVGRILDFKWNNGAVVEATISFTTVDGPSKKSNRGIVPPQRQQPRHICFTISHASPQSRRWSKS